MLWLAVRIVDAANRERETGDGVKVGGHQASSASLVTVMTALWFAHLDGRRPGGGQAARLAGVPRDPVPARRPRPGVPDHAARPRRPAVLPEPHQGPGPGRLLHRLGRAGRGGAAVRRGHPPVRRRALRPARRAAASSRCSATPSWTRATSGRRSPTRRPRAWATCCGSSTSTGSPWTGWCPACGSTSGRSSSPPPAGTSRGEVRHAAAGRVRAARRRGAAPPDRRDAQRAVPGAVRARAGRRTARAFLDGAPQPTSQDFCRDWDRRDAGRRSSPTSAGTTWPACSRCSRECDAVTDRPSVVFAYTVKGWGLPIAGNPRNHSALLTGDADRRAARGGRAGRRRPSGTGSTRLTPAGQWAAAAARAPGAAAPRPGRSA